MLKQAFLKARGCVFLLLFALLVSPVVSQSTSDISTATQVFLNTLSKQELEKTSVAFNDSARLRWNNLPVGLMQRPGIQYGSLSDSSRLAFHRVISMILSSQGYLKVTSIMQLDDILNTLTQDSFHEGRINRQVLTNLQNLDWAYDNYYISVWGHLKKLIRGDSPLAGIIFHCTLHLLKAQFPFLHYFLAVTQPKYPPENMPAGGCLAKKKIMDLCCLILSPKIKEI